MDWAENKAPPELQQFDFVFLISLRDINNNDSLGNIVIKQHRRFKAMDVPQSHVKAILEGNLKVLLLLDGYDQYHRGINLDIDNAISDTIGNCFLVVTSTSGSDFSTFDRDQFDVEVQIRGLNEDNMRRCTYRYLESAEEAEAMIEKCKEVGMFELLQNPLGLLAVSVLCNQYQYHNMRHTDIVGNILGVWTDRSRQKYGDQLLNLSQTLSSLGQLTWEALEATTTVKALINEV